MPNVRSSWKLTYDPSGTPVVLLDIDDRLASEIRWGSTRGAETVPLLDAVAPFLRDSGNRAVSVSFDRMEPKTTHAALCKAVMARLISHGSLIKKPLKIEAKGVAECYWLASACLVPSVEPGILVKGSSEMATSYSLVFASIAEVATADAPLAIPAMSPADPGSLNTTAFSPLDPGDFEAVAFSPSDPGDFEAPAFAPANPGDFTFAGYSPSDPGDGSAPVVPGMMVAGTLTPDATGFLPRIADIDGKPAYGVGDFGETVFPSIILQWQTTSGTAGRWVMGYYPNISGGSAWATGIREFALQPTPNLAPDWAPGGAIAGGATPTGTPTFTAV
jgi:hypothetical protein